MSARSQRCLSFPDLRFVVVKAQREPGSSKGQGAMGWLSAGVSFLHVSRAGVRSPSAPRAPLPVPSPLPFLPHLSQQHCRHLLHYHSRNPM